MSMSSLRKPRGVDIDDSIEDFRAAFICITNSASGYFKSSRELFKALQTCGRNPTQKQIDFYWKSFNEIGLKEFIKIAKQETKISERELIEAFQVIDRNKDGYISMKELAGLFTTMGEEMSMKDVNQIMAEADYNNDGKLNYREFTKIFIDTIERSKRIANKKMNKIISQKDFELEHFSKDSVRDKEKSRFSSLLSSRSFDDFDRKSDSNRHDLRLNRENSLDSARKNQRSKNRQYDSNSDQEKSSRNSNKNFERSFDSRSFKDTKKQKDRYDDEDRPSARDMTDRDRHTGRNSSRSDRERNTDRKRTDRDNLRDLDQKTDRYPSKSSARSLNEISRDLSLELSKKMDRKKLKYMQIFEKKHRPINSVTDDFQEPRNLRKWRTKSIKGAFYYNEAMNGIVSNSFAIDLERETSIYLTIETFKTPLHQSNELVDMDASVLIVKNSKNLMVKGFTENKIKNKWCTRVDLKAGRYFLFPFTSGCHLKKRVLDTERNPPSFFKTDMNNKRTISRQFKDALSVMFDMCDLDSNGRLNQEELNLYTFLTANENLSDEEWHFVGDTVGFEKNELTLEGFIQLSKIEASREDTDIEDIAMRINNMGFNKSLHIDQSCPYTLNVSSEGPDFDLLIGEIYKLKAAEKFICQFIEQRSEPKVLRNLTIYEYSNNYLSFIGVQNQSPIEQTAQVDCSKSANCITNHDFSNDLSIKPDKSKIAMILTAKNMSKEWFTVCRLGVNEGDKPT